jgi:secondary thiamine-phosphate synthase enzyme
MVHGEQLNVSGRGFSEVCDITAQVQQVVRRSGVRAGLVNVSVIGSTASVSTIEHEPALERDFEEQIDRLVPRSLRSRHSAAWGDDNGFSHIRATLMGPSLTVPVVDSAALLGTWQQIVVVDHDNRPRQRQVYVQVIGD